MAPRPIWKGYLKLSLVACAVELASATDHSEKVSFRTLNRKTGNTVRRQYIDSATGKPVEGDDEVKGFEVGEDEFILVEEAEIDAVQIESSHTLSIENFVDRADVPQIYFDQPYYMLPADDVSEEAFFVIQKAMLNMGKAGLARIVLYRRERPVMIEPFGRGMLLTTLRYDKTVRRPEDVFGSLRAPKLDRDLIDLATHIIEQKEAEFDASDFEDRYENALLALIEAKKKGAKPVTSAPKPPAPNVVNLFEALKKSLGESGGSKKAPARKSSSPASPRRRSGGKR